MTQELNELIEQIAGKVITAEPSDLRVLADVHTGLQSVRQGFERQGGAETAVARSAEAESLVERIILNEVEAASNAMDALSRMVAELQLIAQNPSQQNAEEAASARSADAAVPAEAAPASTTSAVAPASHSSIPAEHPVSPDDLPLVQEFLAEAGAHLETAEAEILKLEQDSRNIDTISAIFRSFHTIKGVAGFLNLKQIGCLAHEAENLLDLARKQQISLEGHPVDLILESIDMAKSLLASLAEAATQGQAMPPSDRLPDLLSRLRAAANGTAMPAPASVSAQQTAPVEASKSSAAQSTDANSGDATVKVSTCRLDKLIDMVGELVIAQSMVSQDVHAMLAGNQRLGRNMSQLGKLTRELQDLSMSMRMVPVAGVFQKMARVVRDLARKSGKEIDFVVTGGETELDRNMVEAIADPLVHMVRNSADHGIEPPDDRVRLGKPRAGKVELKAFHLAGRIVIEITDDGRGLNKQKILKKAISAGIVREGEELSEAEIHRLIFHAGLSTAEKITDVSGRGVGMDVVRKNVESLGGRVELSSVEGSGSTFAIQLPLTLAVIDGLIVRVGAERYIIPINSIEQSLRPQPQHLSTVQGRGELCHVHGQHLVLHRLYKLFGVNGAKATDPSQGLVVVLHDNERRCCVLVDELLGQQQVVIKALGEAIGQVRGVSGGAILGDGSISLILDVPGLMELATGTPATASNEATNRSPQ